jgi:hypothetical protein
VELVERNMSSAAMRGPVALPGSTKHPVPDDKYVKVQCVKSVPRIIE